MNRAFDEAEQSRSKFGFTLTILAFIVFVDFLGLGLIFPVLPFLIQDLGQVDVTQAAEIGGFIIFSYAFMQFLFAPVIGGASDALGRRPVLLVTLAVLGLSNCLIAIAPTLDWLIAGRLVSGIVGATAVTAYSAVADCVPLGQRGKMFGVISGAGALGYVFGPAIGGIAGEVDTRLPFIVAAGLAFAGTLAGLFLLKETLPKSDRRRFSLARANPVGSLLRVVKSPPIRGYIAVTFLIYFAAQSQYSIWPYWGAVKFGWSPLLAGLTVAFYGILLAVSQGYFTGKCIARFGDAKTALWSLAFAVPSYLMTAFAPSTSFVLAAIVVGAIPGMTLPALQGIMTAKVPEDAQGELQGAIASTSSISVIAGPIVASQLFAAFSDDRGLFLPSAPFFFSAIVVLAAVLLLATVLAIGSESQ
jgi:DHA1 family tetracycline resistance protein-like MFS transporter